MWSAREVARVGLLLLALLLALLSPANGQAVGSYLGWLTNPLSTVALEASGPLTANDLHCNPVQQFSSLPAAGVPLVNFQTTYYPYSVSFPGPTITARMALYAVNASNSFNLVAYTTRGSDLQLPYIPHTLGAVTATNSGPLSFAGNASSYTLLPSIKYSLCIIYTAGNLSSSMSVNVWYSGAGADVAYAVIGYYLEQPLPNPYPAATASHGNSVFQYWMNGAVPVVSSSSSSTGAAASAAGLPPVSAFPLVQPSAQPFGVAPFYMVGQPQFTPGSLGVYAFDETAATLYAINGSGLTASNTDIGNSELFYFEARPQAATGLVWLLADNGQEASGYYDSTYPDLVAFDSFTLQRKRTFPYASLNLRPAPNMTLGFSFLATDSQGLLYLALVNQIYVISPVNGTQLGYFSVAGPDESGLEFNQGYFIAFDPSDTLWIIDGNPLAPLGTLQMWRTTKRGAVLNTVSVLFPDPLQQCSPGCYLQSFAVDSSGTAYVTLYNVGGVHKVSSALVATGPYNTANPQYPTGAGNYDIEVAVSWGPTPAQDLVYTIGYLRPPIVVQTPTFSFVGTVVTIPTYDPIAISYDVYLDSVLVSNSFGLYSVVRLNQKGLVVDQWNLGLLPPPLGAPVPVFGLAGDGTGVVAMAGIGTDGRTAQLWLYSGQALLFQKAVGQGQAVAISGGSQLVYVPSGSLGGTTIEAYSYSGVLTLTISAPSAFPFPEQMRFIRAPDQFNEAELVMCDGATDTILSVLVATGQVSTAYSGAYRGAGGAEAAIYSFAYSADSTILYVAGTSKAMPYGGVWAANAQTGEPLAQLDLQGSSASLVAVTASNVVLVPTSSTQVLIFPGLTLPALGTYLGWYTDPAIGGVNDVSGEMANDFHCNPVQQFNSLPAGGVPLRNFQTFYYPSTVSFPGPTPTARVALYAISPAGVWNLVASTTRGVSDLQLPYVPHVFGLLVATNPAPLSFAGGASSYTLLPGVNYSLCAMFTAANLSANLNIDSWYGGEGASIGYALRPYYIEQPAPNPYPIANATTGTAVFQLWMNGPAPIAPTSTGAAGSSTAGPLLPISAFPMLEPFNSVVGLIIDYMICQPQFTPGSTGVYAFDPSYSVLYAFNGSGVTASNADIGDSLLFYFEARPQASTGLVWTLADNGLAASGFYDSTYPDIVGFDSITLQRKRTFPYASLNLRPASNMTLGFSFLATDSQGILYLAQGNQIYVISPVNGTQLGYFSVAGPDESGRYFNYGYFIAFDPSDTLWIIDSNALAPLGTLQMWRTTKTGVVLNTAHVLFPDPLLQCSPYCYLQSFAVDSSGTAYVTLYYIGGVHKVTAALVASGPFNTANPQYPPPPQAGGYDIEIAVSWGATPAQDLVYTAGYLVPPVIVQTPALSFVSTVSTISSYDPLAIAYDTYLQSFLLANSVGLYSVVRLNQQGQVIDQWFLGFLPVADLSTPFPVFGLAGDGAGVVAMAGLGGNDGQTAQLWLYSGQTLLFQKAAGQGQAVAIDGGAHLVYVPSGSRGGTTIETYNYAGVLVTSISAPAAFPYPQQMQFLHGITQFGQGQLMMCDAATDVVLAVQVSNGAASVAYSGYYRGGGGPEAAVYSFAFSADGTILYVAGSSKAAPFGGVWAANAQTGEPLAQLDLQGSSASLMAVGALNTVLVATPGQQLLFYAGVSLQASGTYIGWYTDPLVGTFYQASSVAANDLHCNPVQQFNSLPAGGVPLRNFQTYYYPSSVTFPGPTPTARVALYAVNASNSFNLVAYTTRGVSDLQLPYVPHVFGPVVTSSGPLSFTGGASSYTLVPNQKYALCVMYTALNLSLNADVNECHAQRTRRAATVTRPSAPTHMCPAL